jgi:dTMP kinase
VGLPAPDLVVFLDIDPTIAQVRGGFGTERYEALAIQKRVRDVFRRLADDTASSSGNVRWKVVDAAKGMDEVAQEIERLAGEVTKGNLGPVGELWRK